MVSSGMPATYALLGLEQRPHWGLEASLSTEFVHLELLGRHEVMLALVVYGAYVRLERRITTCLRACVVRLRRVQGCQKSTAP